MITLKKNKSFVLSGDQSYSLKTQNYQVLSSRSKNDRFTIKEKDNESIIQYKDKNFIGEIAELKQNKCTVLVNGNTYNFTIDTEATFQRKEKLRKNNLIKLNCNLLAPMPGKITEVLTAEGCIVEKGSPLVLLEAMKMQNQILAAQDGTISKILVKDGDSVMSNQVLIEID
ncbi:acetyl-CoA carboxylase biotin carboxyl carrier protein subunit [Labilibaculum manganireducens]|uniref:acetyl-CoA carboxylase biotin carboxyl carrier protein subunit n=1 Tax=Labilibaculum manganireducens TaxID=1940525 RepID=UPI0029F500BA|nr:acetyl-CoA carboxylase biotin carboxyl carrier protein subunit [Labilibaculum manganireducens]